MAVDKPELGSRLGHGKVHTGAIVRIVFPLRNKPREISVTISLILLMKEARHRDKVTETANSDSAGRAAGLQRGSILPPASMSLIHLCGQSP